MRTQPRYRASWPEVFAAHLGQSIVDWPAAAGRIARTLSLQSRLVILDEPTSSLTESETDLLFAVLRDLKQRGISILYISHRLKEVEAIADRVTVLRDGKNAGELEGNKINHHTIVQLMVGRDLKQFFRRHRGEFDAKLPPVIKAQSVRWSPAQAGIDFAIEPGEIVGMAGLIGAGRTELAETLFGVRRMISGSLIVDGRPVVIRRPADAIRAGIFLIPEDRRIEGLILGDTVRQNISLATLWNLSRCSIVLLKREEALVTAMCARLKVRTPSSSQIVGLLSGGNQQKVVLAKWLATNADVC